MFIAIASSSPTSPSRAARHHPPPGLSPSCWYLCLDKHSSWKSQSCNPKNGRGIPQQPRRACSLVSALPTPWVQAQAPIFPHPTLKTHLHQPDTLFSHTPIPWRSSSDQTMNLEELLRPNPKPGEALQPNLWTSCFPQQLPSTSLPANSSHSHAGKEPPSPSHCPRTWLRGSIPFSQGVQHAPRARSLPTAPFPSPTIRLPSWKKQTKDPLVTSPRTS